MHWNNGKFHEHITVGDKIYITDHRHVAISGTYNFTQFGESTIDTHIEGKNILINSNNNVNIRANSYINLSSNNGITINNSSYGTNLPTTGNVEGKIFFKLIS